MVCVDQSVQGQGRARELIEYAKSMAKEKGLPILIGTDMENYAEMYMHLGFILYNKTTATSGVTRYNLVWKP